MGMNNSKSRAVRNGVWNCLAEYEQYCLSECKYEYCRSELSLFKQPFPGGPGLAVTRMSSFWILLESLRVMEQLEL